MYKQPDKNGFFGPFGGSYVPPQLEKSLHKLTIAYYDAIKDISFQNDLKRLYRDFAGRPSRLFFAKNLTRYAQGAKMYLKREDLNHTGAHKINNALGQALIAMRMGKKKLIAETGAGQHGVATATVAAYFGMGCDIYMGERDIKNERPNVFRMKILGARVIPVTTGQKTLKDAVDMALSAYIKEPESFYLLGSTVGPHPYPTMVRDFQKIIGEEIKSQIMLVEGQLPHSIVACVGGGSNALGAFYSFIDDPNVHLVAVEPAGKGIDTDMHGLALGKGKPSTIHGYKTRVLVHPDGSIATSYSAASGLDYPGVGPEIAYLAETGRVSLATASDAEAVDAFSLLSRTEGIIPALESAHAVAHGIKLAKQLHKNEVVVVNLSGRGDKDVEYVYKTFLEKK